MRKFKPGDLVRHIYDKDNRIWKVIDYDKDGYFTCSVLINPLEKYHAEHISKGNIERYYSLVKKAASFNHLPEWL